MRLVCSARIRRRGDGHEMGIMARIRCPGESPGTEFGYQPDHVAASSAAPLICRLSLERIVHVRTATELLLAASATRTARFLDRLHSGNPTPTMRSPTLRRREIRWDHPSSHSSTNSSHGNVGTGPNLWAATSAREEPLHTFGLTCHYASSMVPTEIHATPPRRGSTGLGRFFVF